MEELEKLLDLAERMRVVAASKNMNLSDVTISKTLIVQENEHAVKTRIPGTWGDMAQYIWINKENIKELAGTGVDGVALVSAIFGTEDIETECKVLKKCSEEMVNP